MSECVCDYSCDWLTALFVEHSLSAAQRTSHLYVRQCHLPALALALSPAYTVRLSLSLSLSNPKLSACVCCEFLSLTVRFLSCHMSDITSVAHKASLSAASLLYSHSKSSLSPSPSLSGKCTFDGNLLGKGEPLASMKKYTYRTYEVCLKDNLFQFPQHEFNKS